ncbi:MAG: DUF4342 domain-containing protein [bacterium]
MVKAKKSSTNNSTEETVNNEFKVRGKEVLEKIRELINEGNVRKIIVKDKNDKTVLELPLTIGFVGVFIAPALAAFGAVAALLTECTISVERDAV